MKHSRFWSPREETVLRRYLLAPCIWREVLPLLPGRTEFGAKHKLQKMRTEAGTVWRVPNFMTVHRRAA